MKICYMVFAVFSFLTGNAQGTDSLGIKIESVIKLKHVYEASLEFSKVKPISTDNISREVYAKSGAGNIDTTLAAYMKEINLIKASKKQYTTYLENVISSKDSLGLTERFIMYNYECPLSSIRDKNNILTKLSYYKIFKYFILDSDRITLPTLSEATAFLKE